MRDRDLQRIVELMRAADMALHPDAKRRSIRAVSERIADATMTEPETVRNYMRGRNPPSGSFIRLCEILAMYPHMNLVPSVYDRYDPTEI
jgi:hypothetical protein